MGEQETFRNALGERIRLAREEANLSLVALAQQIGSSRSAVSRWERGESEPEWSSAVALARVLNRDVAWFAVPHDAEGSAA